jgi:sugar phosphate isomerase/epimerase
MSEQTRQFAFGRNEVDGCTCPAVTAGFDPVEGNTPGLMEAAGRYDRILSRRSTKQSTGVVSEAVARDAWIEVLESAMDGENYVRRNMIDIAVELGWVDREDYQL